MVVLSSDRRGNEGVAHRPRTVEEVREPAADRGCRTFRLRRDVAGLRCGDIVFVLPGARPEGGEFVVDHHFRLGRHGGDPVWGPVWGVVVGMVRTPFTRPSSRRGARSPRAR